MPPPVPPTTPTGTTLPEAAVAAPGLLLLPITIARTTATITTTEMIAPMTTGSGPPFGVTFAIFLEASGRIWVVSLSEQTVVKAVQSVRSNDEPHGAGGQACVAQYFPRVLRLRRRNGSPATETSTVKAEPPRPRRDD